MTPEDLKTMDIEATAAAIEADEGEPLSGLREALAEARAGGGQVTTDAQSLTRTARVRCDMS